MKYLCLVYGEEKEIEALNDDHCMDYDQTLRSAGKCLASEALQPVRTAATVRVRDGKMSVKDGPFAETKECLAGFYLIASGKRHGSFTLEADGKHLLADAVTSAAVLVALAIVKLFNAPIADPIAALCIAVYITTMSIGLLRRSAAGLMDEQDLKDDARIRQILDSHVGAAGKDPRICSYHKLRHRHSGRYHWVDFHIMVPAQWDIDHGHRVASAIEYEIEQALGEGNATAHVEPCADPECAACAA